MSKERRKHDVPSETPDPTPVPDDALRDLAGNADLADLTAEASALRDTGHGTQQSYSRKVFIPLTQLCRDVCHYCTFAQPPKRGTLAYLSPEEVLAIARAGAETGCKEALFTLGDKPELRYRAAREALAELGHETTLSYLADMAALVLAETGLLPHINAGVMDSDSIAALRRVSVSQGLMLESTSERLCGRGRPHHGSPDKRPAARLETIRLAGAQQVPFTSGILIGIGETRAERVDALIALRDLHRGYGHIQEIIVQNFRAKPDTRMADAPEPGRDELVWTIAVARLAFGADMNIQAPPNLSPGEAQALIEAGINDWGGISPVTRDHVNPEAPWPAIGQLRGQTEAAGKTLVERLAAYPAYCRDVGRWQDPEMRAPVLRAADSDGFARADSWSPGADVAVPRETSAPPTQRPRPLIDRLIARASAGERLDEPEIATLFRARGRDFEAVRAAANALRHDQCGPVVRYVVNRNINYTNVCGYKCRFCAFSKGKLAENLRGAPFDLALDEVARRAVEAWDRGATEVCMQGGIHPHYTGETYLELCRAVRAAAPDLHIHSFSPLEVSHGAATLGLSVPAFLKRLMGAGLGSLPGTAAEILDDRVRETLCPDKLDTRQWLDVIGEAHRIGLRTTATIMFGHIDGPDNWARHLLQIRDLQARHGGFTEFVPLPFVHMEAPLYLKGRARKGPTYREAVLMHALARLALHPLIPNNQVSWVKLGPDATRACLDAGANDLGGTLMNESISRAAGNVHGQEMGPERMEHLIRSIGREPEQRTTLYRPVAESRRRRSFGAPALTPPVQTPAGKYARPALEPVSPA